MAKKKKADESVTEGDALELLIGAIDKQFGKGAVFTSRSQFPEMKRVSSGSVSLDLALGGGYPRGRIVEISGMESAGKTTICLHAIAEFQKRGYRCAFVDAEHALDVDYAANLNVDIDSLLISQPDTGEQALQIVDMMVRSGQVQLIVVDSVAALLPQQELAGEIGQSHVGLQARLMSQALRKLTGICSTNETTVIFINQIRSKIGVTWGSNETTSGGNSLKFYASQRLDIRRIATLAEGDQKTGITSRIKVVKNKCAPPFKQAEVNIKFGEGISFTEDLLNVCLNQGIIKKAGAWFSYNGEQLGQGTTKAAQGLVDQGLVEKLYNQVMGKPLSEDNNPTKETEESSTEYANE